MNAPTAILDRVSPERPMHVNKNDSTLCVLVPKINIPAEIDHIYELGLLDRLLEDKTTNAHITWATGEYKDRGPGFAAEDQVHPWQLLGSNSGVVRASAAKAAEQPKARTCNKAEVFTPVWVVKKMNDHILVDAHEQQPDWRKFVNLRLLEITCGEGTAIQ